MEMSDHEKSSDTPDRWSRLQDENNRLKHALEVPAVWSQEERDGMADAFRCADSKHGHYETLFAVAAWLLRHRAKAAAAR
jgi:hypothetical protein